MRNKKTIAFCLKIVSDKSVHSLFLDKITFKENTEFTALNYKGVAAGSLNEGIHNGDSVWISDLNKHSIFMHYFSVFSLVFVLIEKIMKHSVARRVFNSFSVFGNLVKHDHSCSTYYKMIFFTEKWTE